MTGTIDRVEVSTSLERRRRRSAEEKTTILRESYAPRYRFRWWRASATLRPNQLAAGGSFTPRTRGRQWTPAIPEKARGSGCADSENEVPVSASRHKARLWSVVDTRA